MRVRSILFLSSLMFFHACKKDDGTIISRSAPTLDTPLTLQLDSTCMKAPNVITANGDGINDRFAVVHNEPLQSFSLSIMNPNGNVIHSSADPDQDWSGYDVEFLNGTGPIPYLYTIDPVTMSGNSRSVSKVVHVIRDIYTECISGDVPPEAGDQYDPRRLCDHLYPTNDMVCVE